MSWRKSVSWDQRKGRDKMWLDLVDYLPLEKEGGIGLRDAWRLRKDTGHGLNGKIVVHVLSVEHLNSEFHDRDCVFPIL